ncbi:MAG: formate dehydrogenase accessory sulfurtransferase FdhD [Bacteroidota bacterium]
MANRRTKILEIVKIQQEAADTKFDHLAIEEPLEIQIEFGLQGKRQRNSISVTMRTPRHDADLAVGFLFTEGIIKSYEQIKSVGPAWHANRAVDMNSILVVLQEEIQVDLKRLERHFYTSSSCGVCGKSSIDAVRQNHFPSLPQRTPLFEISKIHHFPSALQSLQSVFEKTGGLHAAALFDPEGKLHLLREDVGRHNAVDKLIGAAISSNLFPLNDFLIMVSGRVSFELVQKSLMAGLPAIAAVGAPSSLAVELAEEFGMTVLGFVRNQRFNIYSGAQRIVF